jgi:GNAT superfamily N-acetyltransferase
MRLEVFRHKGSKSLEEMTADLLLPSNGPEETFVLMVHGEPVACASLVRHDLPSRDDLTPWLAGVAVDPHFRGRGYGIAVVRQVEEFARAAGVETLWLYTWSAEGLYAKMGWKRAGDERDENRGIPVILMRRDLRVT